MRRFDKHIPILSGLGDWARLRLILPTSVCIVIARRFQALMVVRVNTNAISSCSLKGARARSKTASGTWPSVSRAFALGVKRRLLPRVEHVESLLSLAQCAGVFRMHVEAVRAPIDLRGAHL